MKTHTDILKRAKEVMAQNERLLRENAELKLKMIEAAEELEAQVKAFRKLVSK